MRRFLRGLAIILTLLPGLAAAQGLSPGWISIGGSVTLSVSSTSNSVVLPGAGAAPAASNIKVCNIGGQGAYVNFGLANVVAYTSTSGANIAGAYVLSNQCQLFTASSATYIAAITTSSTTTITAEPGIGFWAINATCPSTTLAPHNFATGTDINGCPTGAALVGGDLPPTNNNTLLGNNSGGVAAPSGAFTAIIQIGSSSLSSMLTTAGTRYGLLNGNSAVATSPTSQPIFNNGNNLQFTCTLYNTATPPVATAPGVGNSQQFNMYLNGTITGAPTCTISGGSATTCSDKTTLPAVTAAEPAAYQVVTSGTPPAGNAACSAAMVQTP